MIDPFIMDLLVYFIYFVVALALWHYAVPKVVKKEVKHILGIFFKWLLFGKKSRDRKRKNSKNIEKGVNPLGEKDERIKKLEKELAELKKPKKVETSEKKVESKPMKEYKDVNKEVLEHQKKTKEAMKDLWGN